MSNYNLLTEKWIPLRHGEGEEFRVAPCELPDVPADADLAIARPDFRAGVMEFLIGLVQTALSPSKKACGKFHRKGCSSDVLKEALLPLEPYFNLFGDRPRFMQDLLLTEKECKERSRIDSLLIDNPGGNTLKNNGDFFVKRGGIDTLCPSCAAMALITMQSFAPAGGAGIRTSLRGGGPLVTIAAGKGVWDTICKNVIAANEERTLPDLTAETVGTVFPWTVPTKISDGKGTEYYRANGHFLQHFWGMPRRVVFLEDKHVSPQSCDICKQKSTLTCSSLITKPRGNNYGDDWQHPLTPYFNQGNDKPTLSIKASANGLLYTNWLGYAYGSKQDPKTGKCSLAATCIQQYLSSVRHREKSKLHVKSFGYSMDNMKPLQWVEGSFPVYPITGDMAVFRQEITQYLDAADKVQKNMVAALKVALYADKGRGATVGNTQLASIVRSFWSITEHPFFVTAEQTATAVNEHSDNPEILDYLMPLRSEWCKTLCRTAEEMYLQHAESEKFSAQKMEKIYKQLLALKKKNSAASKKALQLN
ncbi:type I-E CRISPR-associated protein Cse1/CasA [Halodesulfovibrio sp.]|jgi:CRISPR system Cascade subunit CasA|uniref:type I-E CRISPR-associated protein Cse1/CasA n=1 Tax=Halodesulfovibrio sp. TaxID=1912772 RepID=UPI0025CCBE06|nr:type I-E CRISPR-associated protein Cse1/CasA [Halodesulfovibrio sp.]MCT4533715.1 type I-E CRISPR-associated protein Cse1/CasA [Halodesulfovibrio sp.]